MPDIYHSFPINSPAPKVFEAISTPEGLAHWWTKTSKGKPGMGEEYELNFGPEFNWRAIVTKYEEDAVFELQMTRAMDDWMYSRVGFTLFVRDDHTQVNFYHSDWPENSEHYRISCYCWAMYLRILKRYLEFGEEVEYENRLDV